MISRPSSDEFRPLQVSVGERVGVVVRIVGTEGRDQMIPAVLVFVLTQPVWPALAGEQLFYGSIRRTRAECRSAAPVVSVKLLSSQLRSHVARASEFGWGRDQCSGFRVVREFGEWASAVLPGAVRMMRTSIIFPVLLAVLCSGTCAWSYPDSVDMYGPPRTCQGRALMMVETRSVADMYPASNLGGIDSRALMDCAHTPASTGNRPRGPLSTAGS